MQKEHAALKPYLSLGKIVIAHYICAAVTFLALVPMLLFSVKGLEAHYFHPHLLAITHSAALGWGSIIIIGLCYQLMPVILDSELYSSKLAWFGLVVFYLGLIALVYSFWVFEPGLHMQCGSLLLLTGILSFIINLSFTARKIKNPDIHQDFILTSSTWLLVTAILGVLMVFNFRYAFLPKDHLLFLRIHAHAGLVGWFLLLIIGLSTKLLSLFSIPEKGNLTLLKWSYYLINFGLIVFFINTFLFDLNTSTYFIATIGLSGVICWLIYIYQCVKGFTPFKLDATIAHTLLSIILLIFAVFLLPFIVFYQLSADVTAIRLTTVYGSLLLFGWISSLLLGQTFKTFPFGFLIYGSKLPSSLKPNLTTLKLYDRKILNIQFSTFSLFIISFSLGVAFSIKPMIYFGIVCFSMTAVLYISNIFIVLLKIKKDDFS